MAIPFEVVIVTPEGTELYRLTSDELESHKKEKLDKQTTEMNQKHISSMHIPLGTFKDLNNLTEKEKKRHTDENAGFFGTYYVNLHVIMGSGVK